MSQALLSIGSNLGDRHQHLAQAINQLRQSSQLSLVAHSTWHETFPIGGPAHQGKFLNGALLIETALEPEALLKQLQDIELLSGRTRNQRWDARPLDLDILLYDQQIHNTPTLTLPHPRLSFRRFVLEPAAEICPEMRHPIIGWTIAELLHHLNHASPYVALAGVFPQLHLDLAQKVANQQTVQLNFMPEPPLSVRSLSEWVHLAKVQSRCLAQENWDHTQPTLSTFWFDQLKLAARLSLNEPDYSVFCQTWSTLSQQVVQPKLTILICPSLPITSPTLRQLQAELLAYAATPGLGPVLTLATDTPDLLLAETSAAMKAIQ